MTRLALLAPVIVMGVVAWSAGCKEVKIDPWTIPLKLRIGSWGECDYDGHYTFGSTIDLSYACEFYHNGALPAEMLINGRKCEIRHVIILLRAHVKFTC